MPSFWDSQGNLVNGRFELSGRNVVQTTVLNAVALTNTNTNLTVTVDVSAYREFEVVVVNTLADASAVAVPLRLGFADDVGNSALAVVKLDNTVLSYSAGGGAGTALHNVPSTPQSRYTYLNMLPLRDGNTLTALTSTDVTDLYPWKKIKGKFKFSYKAGAVPTTGAVTIFMLGVPN